MIQKHGTKRLLPECTNYPLRESTMKPLSYTLLLAVALTGFRFHHLTDSPRQPANEILILATHYLSYAEPGGPVYDVLDPEKQADLQEMIAHLGQFQPTRITLDIPAGSQWDTLINDRYKAYLSGDRRLSRSVEEQIGFRLGEMTGQRRLYGIGGDTAGEQLIQSVGQGAEDLLRNALAGILQERSRVMSQRLARSSSIEEFFRYLNDPATLTREQSILRNQFERMATSNYMTASDLLAAWYDIHRERLHHLRSLVRPHGERVIMIVPAAYAPLLRELVHKSADWHLVDADAFLQVY
jgi:hypothetical protein